MNSRLVIIALCPQTPHHHAGGGGPVRSYFVLEAVARDHDVTLAVLDIGEGVPAPLAARCRVLVPPDAATVGQRAARNGPARWLRAFGAAFGDGPRLLTDAERNCVTRAEGTSGERRGVIRRLAHTLYAWWLFALVQFRAAYAGLRPARGSERLVFYHALIGAIVAAHRQHAFTHIWVEHTYMIPEGLDLARRLGGLPLIIDAHNVESVLHERLATLMKSRTARRWYRAQARRLRRVEAEGFRRSDQVFCCSDKDAQFIRDLARDAHIQVIPNGVDTNYMRPVGVEAPDPTLVFVGSFGYFPNVDAVEYFHSAILPLIWKSVPGCRFAIVGYGADQFASLAGSDPRILILADLPDIRPELSRAWAVVVPLRTGSGTRLKILDAIAMGKAVVSTPIGAEGIDLESAGAGIIAAEVSAFAARTVLLLTDRRYREEMGIRGRFLAERVYSWRVIAAKLADLTPRIANPC